MTNGIIHLETIVQLISSSVLHKKYNLLIFSEIKKNVFFKK